MNITKSFAKSNGLQVMSSIYLASRLLYMDASADWERRKLNKGNRKTDGRCCFDEVLNSHN